MDLGVAGSICWTAEPSVAPSFAPLELRMARQNAGFDPFTTDCADGTDENPACSALRRFPASPPSESVSPSVSSVTSCKMVWGRLGADTLGNIQAVAFIPPPGGKSRRCRHLPFSPNGGAICKEPVDEVREAPRALPFVPHLLAVDPGRFPADPCRDPTAQPCQNLLL